MHAIVTERAILPRSTQRSWRGDTWGLPGETRNDKKRTAPEMENHGSMMFHGWPRGFWSSNCVVYPCLPPRVVKSVLPKIDPIFAAETGTFCHFSCHCTGHVSCRSFLPGGHVVSLGWWWWWWWWWWWSLEHVGTSGTDMAWYGPFRQLWHQIDLDDTPWNWSKENESSLFQSLLWVSSWWVYFFFKNSIIYIYIYVYIYICIYIYIYVFSHSPFLPIFRWGEWANDDHPVDRMGCPTRPKDQASQVPRVRRAA